jgi:hypothetical protein
MAFGQILSRRIPRQLNHLCQVGCAQQQTGNLRLSEALRQMSVRRAAVGAVVKPPAG